MTSPDVPSRGDVRQKLLDVLAGRITREEASTWTDTWVVHEKAPVEDSVVWEALERMSGMDIRVSGTDYLHGEEDIRGWIDDIENASDTVRPSDASRRNLDHLVRVSPTSRLLVLETDTRSAGGAVWQWRQAGLTVRVVRGGKMRTYERLMDEFAAAFQFPYYFGENWPAFAECLSDLDWLPLDVGVVVIRHATEVLADEPIEMGALVRAFEHIRGIFAEPIDQGQLWDRPALPFHVVLHCEPGDTAKLADHWRSAGAELAYLDPTECPVD